MGMPFLKPSKPVVGVDFALDALKAIQLQPGADVVTHAAAINTPTELRHNADARVRWQFDQLPKLLKQGRFAGKRAVCAVSSQHTVVETLAVAKAQGIATTDLINEKIRSATGFDPNTLVVRHEEVGEVARNGAKTTETLCFAIPRAVVKEHMKALKKAGFDTVGIHCKHTALALAMQRCTEDDEESATITLDLYANGSRAIVTSQGRFIAARTIHADVASALQPQQLGATGTDGAPTTLPPAAGFMTSGPLDTVAEELGQVQRYGAAVRPDLPIKHALFAGSLSTNDALCADLARRLRLPARLADPLANYAWAKKPALDAPEADSAKPAWAVALGLCLAPTDL